MQSTMAVLFVSKYLVIQLAVVVAVAVPAEVVATDVAAMAVVKTEEVVLLLIEEETEGIPAVMVAEDVIHLVRDINLEDFHLHKSRSFTHGTPAFLLLFFYPGFL